MIFRDLAIGDRFQFASDYGFGWDWPFNVKTGERTFETQRWQDGSGAEAGRVGVGDNPVRKMPGNGQPYPPEGIW